MDELGRRPAEFRLGPTNSLSARVATSSSPIESSSFVSNSHNAFSRRIGYRFRDASLLELALTHRSYGGDNNERLDFLGDSIVNFVIGEAHAQTFTVECHIDMLDNLTRGVGSSRRHAEQEAAQKALALLDPRGGRP